MCWNINQVNNENWEDVGLENKIGDVIGEGAWNIGRWRNPRLPRGPRGLLNCEGA